MTFLSSLEIFFTNTLKDVSGYLIWKMDDIEDRGGEYILFVENLSEHRDADLHRIAKEVG
jgi:hypothetical protein